MIDYIVEGNWTGKAVNEQQLHAELEAAGVKLGGVGLAKDEKGKTLSVRVHLPSSPTSTVKGKIKTVLTAHAPKAEANQPNPQPRMEALRAKRRAGQALTAAEQQELLDLLLGV